MPKVFNLLRNFSAPCLPVRWGCENLYQTCFSTSLWQNRWFEMQVEEI